MSESKHTPGPWAAGDTRFQRDFRTFVNVTRGKDYFVACVSADPMHPDNIAANARLIAAAPDLLEALKWAVASEPQDDSCAGWISDARAAIAKAEGRS